ncbi:restriction endonuclease [Marinobacter sp. ATCH36]|uniref:restriction endonuclease n=1 Tax=Marinobacter sp. ATCH36 TaxID=2945106 RepID=UPI0020211844|nr:restriction endonuclease [Marinobacter sp. ATCH36]MCL7944787.1 restriction endonuclease [Marinobacter sp. ATCH36]
MIDFSELPSNGTKFEQLVRELFIRSGFEVHWTGVGPDAGRDLVVTEKAEGHLAPFNRKWLVSCKHYANSGKSVGLQDVADVTDACAAVDAQGFLLACSTQPSSTVVRRLEEINGNGRVLTKYLDGVEIEKRLNTPSTFPLISLFFPKSAENFKWKIYNTHTPSFWAANYKDYFLYLGSRTANTFPELKDVEEIVRRLESVKLPEGDNWNRHFIRPRAVYFDNKHENFTVFADYLYPRDKEGDVASPQEIDEYLNDGMGLYSDGEGMWFITHWDIRYVPCWQISDHFHLDHKEYYEPYMDRYRIGFARDEFISEMYQG